MRPIAFFLFNRPKLPYGDFEVCCSMRLFLIFFLESLSFKMQLRNVKNKQPHGWVGNHCFYFSSFIISYGRKAETTQIYFY